MVRRKSEARSAGWQGALGGFLLALLVGLGTGCGGGSSSSGGILTVTVTPGAAVVALGGTQAFTATVANDPGKKGVTWALTQIGIACSPGCGSISATTTASGASVTYSAPGTPLTVVLTATSVSNTTVSTSATITTTGTAAVSVSPTTATVALSGTQLFAATVANDTSNKGVNWSLTQGGAACAPACGSVSPTTTTNGVTTTYTAPAAAPTSNTSVTLTASSIAFPGQTAWATITISGGITVSVSPSYVANVPENGTQKFTATLTNDTSNKGVTWALTQNGASCSPGCGTISATSSTSGVAITYTAPGAATSATLTATSVADTAVSSYATINVQAISVEISPTTANLYQGNTLAFTASVVNDVKNGGVTWTLTENGTGCSPGCGTVSPTSTGSGVATNYASPSTISSAAVVTITATSVTDRTQSASGNINLYPPISVSVAPATASVAIGGRTTFTATVANDPTNAGVQWTLAQGGTSCSPGCGTVSPRTTASGVATTYLAPNAVPSPATVTITAQSVANVAYTASATITVTSSAIAARFAGSYAFSFTGYDSGGGLAVAGRLTADGSGTISGLEDANGAAGVTTAQAFTGTYAIAADGTGSLTLTSVPQNAPLGTFRFALDADGSEARLAALGGGGVRGTGMLERQAAGEFSPASLRGDYGFGASGEGAHGDRLALAGRFHADGAGGIAAGRLDTNESGSVPGVESFTGTYTLSASGRGTLTESTPEGALHWAFYAASAGRILLVSSDPLYVRPLASGEALAQAPGESGAFSEASLSGTSVIWLAGADPGGASRVAAGLVLFDGQGGLTYTMDENNGGKASQASGTGSYSVAPDGRVVMTLGEAATPVVSYLVGRNEALLAGTGEAASSGMLEAQAPGPFADFTLAGNYILRTLMAPSSAAKIEWGRLSSAGAGRLVGSVSGTPETDFAEPYEVSPNGRAAAGGGVVLYFISSSRAVGIELGTGETSPTISEIAK